MPSKTSTARAATAARPAAAKTAGAKPAATRRSRAGKAAKAAAGQQDTVPAAAPAATPAADPARAPRRAARPRSEQPATKPVAEPAAVATVEPAVEPSAAAPRRRRNASPPPAAAADETQPKPKPKPLPKAAPPRARKPRAVVATTPAAAQAQPPEAAPAAEPVRIEALDDQEGPFGRHAVRLPGDEPGDEAAETQLRSTLPGSAWCSCLDFALSEDARCPHVDALLAQLHDTPAWQQGPGQTFSRVVLQHAAQARPLWLAGTECPPALDERARALLGAEVLDDAALPRLLRAAREAGHWVQVDEAVWQHLAAARDARWRVQRLEQLLPEGPASAALQGLTPAPLLPLQAEGALFALCAGRSVLADCAELQPPLQALAALQLARRHFGIQGVLVLAPAEALDGWRRALGDLDEQGAEGSVSMLSLDSVAADAALHRSLDPELVIVHEPPQGGLWVDADRAAALLRLRPAMAIVLPGPGALERAAEWPLRIAFVDADRQGAYAALLREHGERDAAGQLCGLQRLHALRETLAPVLLARSLDEVRAQLPERVDRIAAVPLPASAQAAHAGLRAALVASLQHWRRSGWLPDAAQRRLLAQLQALRRWCAGDGAHDVAAAKAEALRALVDTGTAGSSGKLVAFGQWPQALQAVAGQIGALQPALWNPAQPAAERQAALQRFRADPACRVLLVADGGSAPLDLGLDGLPVVHLDRPWHPRTLVRRFGRVHRRGQAHLVPVVHLVLAGSLEQRLADGADTRGDQPADLPDAQPGDGFLQGDALQAFGDDLARLLQLPMAAEQGAVAT